MQICRPFICRAVSATLHVCQLRRNLINYVRTQLALRLEGVIAARAKSNQQGGQGGVLLLQKSAEASPIDTRHEIAKIAGVSHDTVAKVKKIEAKAATIARRPTKMQICSLNVSSKRKNLGGFYGG